ncbi:MAG: c-type cytochrome [Epsilonproteobacteria bacterium]|nr:c-type cytochrome [Campylobacterota bacterium]
MRKVVKAVTALSVASSIALAGSVIEAVKVDSLEGVRCGSEVIKQNVKFTPVILYPQTTLRMNDKKANELNKDAKAKEAEVAALTDGKEIALILRWKDKTKDLFDCYCSDKYPDGFAVQFAKDASEPQKLPYIGMGSDGRPVAIYIHKAYKNEIFEPNGNKEVFYQVNPHNVNAFGKELEKFKEEVKKRGFKSYQRAFVSEGFRSMTEIKDNSVHYRTDMHYVEKKGGMWGGMVIRPIEDFYASPSKGEFAVAVAVWDGKELQRDGLKRLSGWFALKLPNGENKELEKVVTEKVDGNVTKGKELAMTNCASCHRWKGADMAPPYMAPNLSNIGGQATAAYIKESIIDPNAVIVPGYNRNAHPNFSWYMVDDKGNRTSTMPPFNYLKEEEINDIVAFMQTLKAEVEK